MHPTPLQFGDLPEPSGVDVAINLGSGAVGAYLTTLAVGAILVAVFPDYTERMMATVRSEVVDSFAYGIGALLLLAILVVALFVSVVGILALIPLVLLAMLVWAVGAAIAFLAIAERLVDREDDWLKPLVVAAVLNGALTFTGIGAILSLCIGATGFGAVLREYLE